MRSNPFYHLLTMRRPALTPKISKQQKSYFLLPLPIEQESRLILNEKIYMLKKHHISVYQEYAKEIPTLSATHYTGEYLAEGKNIIVHVYFNKDGDFLATHVNLNNPEKDMLAYSTLDKINIINHVEQFTNGLLNELSNELINKKKACKIKKTEFLKNLEYESLRGMTTSTYITLLTETIAFLSQLTKLEFYPDHKEINFLQKHLLHLQEKMAPKKQKKEKHSKLQKNKICAAQKKDQGEEIHRKESKNAETKDTSAMALSKVEQSQKVEELTLSQYAEAHEHNLYQQLNECLPDDLDNMLKITGQIDTLAKLRCEVLIQACIDGDIEIVKRNFRKIDIDNPDTIALIAALLPTCVYHNHAILFEYIYTEIKNRYIKQFLFAKPYVTLKPKKYPDIICTSILSVAYERKNLEFFKLLLTKYHFNPNCSFLLVDSLLIKIANDTTAIEYMQNLLQAGANPNDLRSDIKPYILLCTNHGKETITPESQFSTYLKPVNQTPLHQAVWSKNIAAILLLLYYRADTSLKNINLITPFGISLFATDGPLNKEIISIFLALGHHIDERQTDYSLTGLYYACQNNDLTSVTTLLEFKANPCAEHDSTIIVNKIPISVRSTPLLVAAVNGHLAIVAKLLKCQISSEELAYTRQECKKYGNSAKDLLRQAHSIACHKEAISAHKENKFVKAEELYLQALKISKNDEEKHMILSELAINHDKEGKKDAAIAALQQCIAIRYKLAQDPLKSMRIQRLIIEAKIKLAKINRTNEPSMVRMQSIA